jgi:DNA uptake protein ComE-like DNA-binding protein
MSSKGNVKVLRRPVCLLLFCALLFVGCTKKQEADNTEKIREQTAKATEEIKKNTTAVVEGVKEGWNRDKTGSVNLNAATKEQLMILPGITGPKADLVIDRRPYTDKHELVTKRILSESEYAKIADRLTVK